MMCQELVAPPCCPFEFCPLNELYRGKLVRSITLIPFEMPYFDDIWYTYIHTYIHIHIHIYIYIYIYIYQSHTRMVAILATLLRYFNGI